MNFANVSLFHCFNPKDHGGLVIDLHALSMVRALHGVIGDTKGSVTFVSWHKKWPASQRAPQQILTKFLLTIKTNSKALWKDTDGGGSFFKHPGTVLFLFDWFRWRRSGSNRKNRPRVFERYASTAGKRKIPVHLRAGIYSDIDWRDYLISSTLRLRKRSRASPLSMPFWSRARSMSWWTTEFDLA